MSNIKSCQSPRFECQPYVKVNCGKFTSSALLIKPNYPFLPPPPLSPLMQHRIFYRSMPPLLVYLKASFPLNHSFIFRYKKRHEYPSSRKVDRWKKSSINQIYGLWSNLYLSETTWLLLNLPLRQSRPVNPEEHTQR